MTKGDLVTAVYKRLADSGLLSKRMVKDVIDGLVLEISDRLTAGKDIRVDKLGRFFVRERAARTGHNPRTGEPIEIQASNAVKFTPASSLKRAVNQ
jgi:DNA-binding protein HU-beta